ncbi:pyridoxamine 5'-phosphate oxidase family protein [Jiangella rhizosphaerae]|uniref:Pyridoxamine 5'-phosphate oxidase family protein n=1 Tax=Jiangella rhizosphaerae TaxID=2293569 RepID=A0A418KPM9_9ACTN|nr:pyridoxamine 5'-phosphate oxidase family protein [Jiangella rhizosphaerae]RIQ21279.1 pyridoxamine 5'-phosphate oxidase family protein [Jiangella rhizosphaerae]
MDALAPADSAGLENLGRADCFALLRTVPIGRIVFTEAALPAIQPVNFVLDGDDVIIRTGWGSKLAAATRSAVVAFEADQYDEDALTGWSVVLVGRAEAVGAEAERARLSTLGLTPWALGDRPHYIRIRPEIVRGRRIRRPAAL